MVQDAQRAMHRPGMITCTAMSNLTRSKRVLAHIADLEVISKESWTNQDPTSCYAVTYRLHHCPSQFPRMWGRLQHSADRVWRQRATGTVALGSWIVARCTKEPRASMVAKDAHSERIAEPRLATSCVILLGAKPLSWTITAKTYCIEDLGKRVCCSQLFSSSALPWRTTRPKSRSTRRS